jgi:hypothetical protein
MSDIKKFDNFKIDLDKKRILKLIGYKKKSYEVKDPVKQLIEEQMKKLDKLLQPIALYTIIDYEETNKHPVFEKARKVVLCICTIGPKLEKEVEKLMKTNEMLKALITDTLGSEAVEEVVIQSDLRLAEEARKMNLWPSKRFSPGYGKWDLKEQGFVFQKLPAQDIGVILKESFMMVPRKSVSFRINFYKNRSLSTRRKFNEGNLK